MSKLPFGMKIALYYLTAYVLTGIFFILQIATGIRGEFIQLPQVGPALAAMIFLTLERKSIKSFLKDGFRFELDRFTVLMFVSPIVIIGLISILTTSLWGIENFKSSNLNIMSAFLVLSTIIAAICEEIGWRGYLLPKLQSRMRPAKATIINGMLWIFWHVPKLMMGIQFFAMWAVGIMGLTFVLTYAFNRSNGNIGTAAVIHSIVNLMAGFFLIGYAADLRVNLVFAIGFLIWGLALTVFGRKYTRVTETAGIEL